MNECPHCNTRNPPQAVTCRVCNLDVPRTNAPSLLHTTNRPKMAVLDLDKTLFDLSRRERAARRQGLKEGTDKWYEFLNQNKYILMDTPIPGTVSFVKQLSDNGFTIAYLSGRPRHSLAATKQSLQENGFPIDAVEQDLVFLHSGKGSIKNITKHKLTVLTHLKNSFDIDFFFDDTPEFREAAKSLFIPGVYSSVASYTGKEERPSAPKKSRSKKARKNPGHGDGLCPKTTAIDPYTGVYYACSKPEHHSGVHDLSIERVSPDTRHSDENPFDNPPPMPRKKRDKAGNMRKEPIKKYTERFMGDKKMNEEFPVRRQRFAVALSYARKFYSDAAVNKAYPPRSNPRPNHSKHKQIFDKLDEKEKEEERERLQKEIEDLERQLYDLNPMNHPALLPPPFSPSPRSNPHTPVHEAKSFYKQFHQKPAKNVKKTKVDIGDTWVGLGKAWSIGYRSGKETGNETQKYIHNFGVDEESGKKFKEPELYYVKNNDGSQMMVIMGGDWYIDVAEDGSMSWIYI